MPPASPSLLERANANGGHSTMLGIQRHASWGSHSKLKPGPSWGLTFSLAQTTSAPHRAWRKVKEPVTATVDSSETENPATPGPSHLLGKQTTHLLTPGHTAPYMCMVSLPLHPLHICSGAQTHTHAQTCSQEPLTYTHKPASSFLSPYRLSPTQTCTHVSMGVCIWSNMQTPVSLRRWALLFSH